MKISVKLCVISVAIGTAIPQALAQDQGESAFKRDRNISVKERPKPEYQTDGIRSGVFVYRPEIIVSSEFDNNIFATNVNTDDDVIISLAPSLTIATDRNVHNFSVFADAETRQYLSFGDESHTNYGVGAEGRLDIQRNFYVDAGAEYRRNHEDRSLAGAARNTIEPISTDRFETFAHIYREAGRVRLQGRTTYRDINFGDARFQNGQINSQDFRERNDLELELRGDYAISPNTSIFGRVRYIDEDYKETVNQISRDQNGFVFDVGADFDVTDFIRGEIGVGLLDRSFDDPARSNFDGISLNGQLEWFATPLITVSATGERSVRPSYIINSAATVQKRFGLSADYEWRRNIVLSIGSIYDDQTFRDVDRTDERLSYFLSGTYLMNRTVGFSASVVTTNYDSDGFLAQNDYDKLEILSGVNLKR